MNNHQPQAQSPRGGDLQQRLRDVRAQEAEIQQQIALQRFAENYELQLSWPAEISGNTRTDNDLLQHRLLEAGVLFDVPVNTTDAVTAANAFIENLQATDCFHSVSVELGTASSTENQQGENERKLHVYLHEKNWYRLHAGAGLKTDWMHSMNTTATTDSFLPTAEVEVSAGVRNLAGVLDRTDLQYAVDTHNIGTWTLTHARPLYSVLPESVSDVVLRDTNGSQYGLVAKAALDTSDHESTSSYKQFQRLLSVKAASSPNASPWHCSLEWAAIFRDVVPRRHANLPYHSAASPEIVAAAGASVKQGLAAVVQYDQTESDVGSGLPVAGLQMQCHTEVAAPPGDVGLLKGRVQTAAHCKLFGNESPVSLHGALAVGGLCALTFGGLCPQPTTHISDRFLLGGTRSFRGFVPGGIGPRAASSTGKMGDALGGNFFYTATAMVSAAPPSSIFSDGISAITNQLRLFGFCTAGTCVNLNRPGATTTPADILKSSRLSAGVGIATNSLGPRIEATYAWPIRFGPNDGRRRFQFGVSFSIG